MNVSSGPLSWYENQPAICLGFFLSEEMALTQTFATSGSSTVAYISVIRYGYLANRPVTVRDL